MNRVFKLSSFIKPYWKWSLMALVLLTTLVFMDLSIPRLIQRIIDQGIHQQNQTVVIQTGLLMLGISASSTVIAVGNNILSVWVGARVWPATCARRCFTKYKPFRLAISTGSAIPALAFN